VTDLISRDGWLMSAVRRSSPHHNSRPDRSDIDLLVIHCISLPEGNYGGPWIDQLFMGELATDAHPSFKSLEGIRVSSHLLIRRDGEVLQYVAFPRRAWHAGVSSWQGRENCNDFSIGIELEGTDQSEFTDAQYAQLVQVTRALMDQYPAIQRDHITGHQHIAPGRKTDPGSGFDWNRYLINL
jgi:AmpD protein